MTDEDDTSSRLLDEDGRLFGLVNIVDLLVVLLLVAVVAAGIVLLLPDDTETETRYATFDLGPQSDSIAEEISEGDTWEPDGTSDTLEITDVYRYNTEDGTNVMVRAALNGTLIEGEEESRFEFLDDLVRIGDEHTIVTDEYEVTGEVTQFEAAGDSLPTTDAEFVLETSLASGTAEELAAGDTFTAGGETVAEIESLNRFPDGDDEYVLVGLSATALDRAGTNLIGNTSISIGESVSFDGDGYSFDGEIIRRGSAEIATEEREFVIQTDVDSSTADDLEVGDSFTLGETPLVTVEEVTTYATGNGDTRTAVLGVEALTRTEGERSLFGTEELRVGSSLPLVTEAYDIDGEITRRGNLEQAGTEQTQTVTMELDNVRPSLADQLVRGLTEESSDHTTAELTTVETESAEVILESDDGNIFSREHPTNKDVELTVDLTVREKADGTLTFRTETLRTGDTVPLELGSITITPEVSSIDS